LRLHQIFNFNEKRAYLLSKVLSNHILILTNFSDGEALHVLATDDGWLFKLKNDLVKHGGVVGAVMVELDGGVNAV